MNLMLEKLNQEQRAAVEAVFNGPVLVTAGAGTGKTSVLIATAATLLLGDENNQSIKPWQIMAVTFTNKAANEIKTRIAQIGANVEDMSWLGTFHSVCLKILRRNADKIGLRKDFLIYDDKDQERVLKNVLGQDLELDEKVAEIIEKISLIKDKGLEAFRNTDKTYVAYNKELMRIGAIDFGDIILLVLKLFDEHPDVLKKYQDQFKYILVDEFQDTNAAQMELLKMLTKGKEKPHIYCVGDEDQSIYSWRGAEIKNIVDFKKTFPTATVKRLETNYRSTGNILNAANSLIEHNVGRFGKVLHPADETNVGQPVYVLTLPTDRDEARLIADTIQREIGISKQYNDYVVLIRSSNQSRLLEEALNDKFIPYRLIGATKFYERTEIRDVIAYLRLLVYPFDEMSFLRVISKPRRGFGPAAIDKLRSTGPNLMSGLRTATLSAKQRANADAFLDAFNFNWMDMQPKDAAQMLLEKSGYLQMWRDSKDENVKDRLENIEDLIENVMAKYDTLPEFLENAALMTVEDDAGNRSNGDRNAVNIMTIHAAKGLEFDTVFLPAWEEGIFPSEKAIYKDIDGKRFLDETALEEERRLAYVAITRAKRRCIISNCTSRWFYDKTKGNLESRFISEMDERYLDFQGGAPRATPSYRTPVRQHTRRATAPETMVGKLVSHVELGHGTVIAENGDVLTVAFGKHGIKNVMKSFVSIA